MYVLSKLIDHGLICSILKLQHHDFFSNLHYAYLVTPITATIFNGTHLNKLLTVKKR